MFNKRFQDIFSQYIYRGEPTPHTLGTLCIVALCFLILIVATFTQLSFLVPTVVFEDEILIDLKETLYSPLIPAMVFIIYLLRKNYSFLMYVIFLLTGFFIWPIFVYGGGLGYVQNYIFGYVIGFGVAIIVEGNVLNVSQTLKNRMKAAIKGVITIHITAIIYCVILALFKVIEFHMVLPIVSVASANNIFYDIVFSCILLFVAPFIKNILWICMKPRLDRTKLKNIRIREQIISNDIY